MQALRLLALVTGFAFAAASCAAIADDALEISGNEVNRDGVLTRRLAEVEGGEGPTSTPILAVANPRQGGSVYEISGTVEYSDVQGDGYLEMATSFPEGQEFFTRTLDPTGALGKLSGSSGPRPFSLPIQLAPGAPAPVRLVLNVVLPGSGHVRLSDLRLSGGAALTPVPDTWWSSRAAALIGGALGSAIAIALAALGVLCSLRRYRSFAEGLMTSLLGLGIGVFSAGVAAVALRQPRVVWLPLLVLGVLAALLHAALRNEVRRRFARAEPSRLGL